MSAAIISIIILAFALFVFWAVATNPFGRFSLVKRAFAAYVDGGEIKFRDNSRALKVRNGLPWRIFAWTKLGLFIFVNRYAGSAKAKADSCQGLAREIVKLRYDPDLPFLISGDHYVASYPRGLGIFNYSTLDCAVQCPQREWLNKQLLYLQSAGFILGVLAKRPVLSTTIVPTGPSSVTCVNSYSYPSDTLYSVLFALAALTGVETARPYAYAQPCHKLLTKKAARGLLANHRELLRQLYKDYRQHVFDPDTELVRQDIRLSGTKDITRRKGSFYDNVIFWKTTELAQKLGIISKNKAWLENYKKKILETFWIQEEGHFLEDLTAEARAGRFYSSDWLIVLATGFISPFNEKERPYFVRSVDYIRENAIDKPFAIKYQQDRRANRLYTVTRLAASSYGGDSIWSFWGMEYLKVLLALHAAVPDSSYLSSADYHIAKYKGAMIANRGFPEVYDREGRLFKTAFYRSVRQTSWVVGFEQVLAMRHSIV